MVVGSRGARRRTPSGGGARPSVAVLAVAALVSAGCLGAVQPRDTSPPSGSGLEAAPEALRPVDPEDRGVEVRDRGNFTEILFRQSDLEFEDAMVTFAVRARENLSVGAKSGGQIVVDRYPEEGWFQTSAVVHDAPVEALFADDASGESVMDPESGWGTIHKPMTIVGRSRLQVYLEVDGDTIVDERQSRPEPVPFAVNRSGNDEPVEPGWGNLSAGEWILVVMGGPSPVLGDGTVIEERIAVDGSFDIYRAPDAPVKWSMGFAREAPSQLAAGAHFYERVEATSIRMETERSSYLHVDTERRGNGTGCVVFQDEEHPIPVQDELSLSAGTSGTIGFEVDQWEGAPFWFMTEAWLPARQLRQPTEAGPCP